MLIRLSIKFLLIFLLLFSIQVVYGQKPLAAARIKSVTVSKSPCFGFCPVYILKVDKKGKVYLDAKHNVPKDLKGNYVTSINRETQQKLADILKEIEQTTTGDAYGDHRVTDLPATDVTIRFCKKKRKTKTIHDYGNKGTLSLEKLYTLTGEIVNESQWEPVKKKH